MSDLTLIHNENGEKYLREVSTAHYALLNNDKATQHLYEEYNSLSEDLNIYKDSFVTEDGVMSELTQEEQAVLDEKQNLVDSKFQEIQNTPSIVTSVIKGKSEIEYEGATEIDNTIYWEGYYGKGGLCKRTSYNTYGGVHLKGGTPFRKNYAGVGYIYDPVRDAFYAPQPFESWTLNEDTCLWEAPIPYPDDTENSYLWDEETLNWITE